MTNYHYFINPKTKRVNKIKKTSVKKFEKDRCLYNKNSVKNCMTQISKKYPNIYAPLSLKQPFKTYPVLHQLTPAVAFFVENDEIIGFVNQKRKVYKLETNIKIKSYFRKFPIVYGDTRYISVLVKKSGVVYKNLQKLKEQLQLVAIRNANLIYNHLHEDFIPIIGRMTPKKVSKILDLFTKNLIPVSLPSVIENGKISGLVFNKNKLVGYVSPNNSIHKLELNTSEIKNHNIPSIEIEDKILGAINTDSNLNDFLSSMKLLDNIKKEDCSKYKLEWDEKYGQCRVRVGEPLIITDVNNKIIGFAE